MEKQQGSLNLPSATRVLAMTSLLCGILGVFMGLPVAVLAIVTGHIALRKIRKSGGVSQLRGLAITGLMLGYILTVMNIFVLIGISSKMNKIQHIHTLQATSQIEMAFQNFYDEYGALPSNLTSDTTFLSNQDTGIFEALLGMKPSLSPKSIQYLSMKQAKDMKNGIVYDASGTKILGIFDPWGGAYKIRLDLDDNDQMDVNGETLKNRKVAVWSDGPDQVAGSADDIKSWK